MLSKAMWTCECLGRQRTEPTCSQKVCSRSSDTHRLEAFDIDRANARTNSRVARAGMALGAPWGEGCTRHHAPYDTMMLNCIV